MTRVHATARAGGMATMATVAAVAVAAVVCAQVAVAAADIELTASIRDANTRLDIAWTLVNRSDRPLLALVKPLQHNEQPAKQTLYSGVGSDGTIEFALKAFAVPAGESAAALDRIGAVPLAAGATLDDVANVELPLARHEPYASVTALPLAAAKARMCIGVVDADAPIPIGSRMADGVVATYHDRAVVAQQRIVCTAPIDIPPRRAPGV